MTLVRSVAVAILLLVSLVPARAHAGFNVHERFPNDMSLLLDLDDGVEELAGVGLRYKIDGYIWGLDVTAQYDRAIFQDHGARDVLHGGSLGGQLMISPIAFVGILLEDKVLPGRPRSFRRLMEWVNLWVPAGVRVGLGTDGEDPRARLAAWVGLELVLRLARADWPHWPNLMVSWRRQAALPEDRASDHIVFAVGFTRFIKL